MDEAAVSGEGSSRYWCHACSRMVSPIMELESVKCPNCLGGFVEEMSAAAPGNANPFLDLAGSAASDPDRALSLWAPILLGMMTNPSRSHRRRSRRRFWEDEDASDDLEDSGAHDDDAPQNQNHPSHGARRNSYSELDRELESTIRRRRRNSASILHLLQGIRAGMISDSSQNGGIRIGNDHDHNGENRDDDPVFLINPFNQTLVIQGAYDPSNTISSIRSSTLGSLGDYFIGPGLDLLLQHLAENDSNRYGTPPAQKSAVEALPILKVDEVLQCAICLEDLDIGDEAKQMPCKHKFHDGCIVPWLQLHSSCPVCRYQMPSDDDSKHESRTSVNGYNNDAGSSSSSRTSEEDDGRSDNGRRFLIPLPWPFNSLFSSQGTNGETSSLDSAADASHHS